MKYHFFAIPFVAFALLGAGCQGSSVPEAVPTPAPAPVAAPSVPPAPSAPAVSTNDTQTILISALDTTQFCNGADMDSDGYQKTLTVEKTINLEKNLSTDARAKEILMAATTGLCRQNIVSGDIHVDDAGALHIPPVDGWAGISITMCSCQPEVEVNALRIPGVNQVIWE